jgi:colicin import membrane protein
MSIHRCWLLTLWLAAAAAASWAADDPAAQRERIATQRRAADANFEAARRDCEQRFQVTSCLDQARASHRAALDTLRLEQLRLDDQQRRQRATERQRELDEKARRAQTPAASAPAAPASARPVKAPPSTASAARSTPPKSAAGHGQAAVGAASAAAAREAANREQYRRRVDEAAAHQAQVQARNAERASRKPPAAGLPMPPAASAASR